MKSFFLENNLNINYEIGNFKTFSDSYNLMLINTRSCRNKIEDILGFLENFKDENGATAPIHIIIVTETWLNELEICEIAGYRSFHSVRGVNKRGGGVSIFCHRDISCSESLNVTIGENNIIIVKENDYNCHFMGCYNNGSEQELFLQKMEEIIVNYKKNYIGGDFNINIINQENRFVSDYQNRMTALGLVFLNSSKSEFSTRYSNSISTIIDHYWSDIFDKKTTLKYFDVDNLLSDHRVLVLSIHKAKLSNPTRVMKTITDYDAFLNPQFYEKLQKCSSYGEFINTCSDSILKYTKTFFVSRKNSPIRPYITKKILNEINIKNKLFKIYKRNPENQTCKTQYLDFKNYLNNRIKKIKQKYYNRLILENYTNICKLWEIMNEIIFQKNYNVKNCDVKSIVVNNDHINDPKAIANCFNTFFVNIGNEILATLPLVRKDFKLFLTHIMVPKFEFSAINADTVSKIIENLNSKSAVGIDRISCRFLKSIKNQIALPISKFINIAFENCIFPNELKMAKVIVLYKTGEKTCMSNYRPISVLPSNSKIIESTMNSQIQNFVLKNKILNPHQFGFLPGSSTVSASVNLMDRIYTTLDNKKHIGIIFLDLKKAFDSMNPNILLQKLHYYNFDEKAIKLLSSYFSNRSQIVSINGHSSQFLHLNTGTPQGAILSPILFNLYVNDMFNISINGFLQMYADDAVLVYSETDLETMRSNMQKDLNNVFYRGLVLYNSIPRNIQNLNISQFKIEVKKFLFHNYSI